MWEFVGAKRFVEAAFCKTARELYFARFGRDSTQTLFLSGAKNGSVDYLRWLLDNGCPLSTEWTSRESYVSAPMWVRVG